MATTQGAWQVDVEQGAWQQETMATNWYKAFSDGIGVTGSVGLVPSRPIRSRYITAKKTINEEQLRRDFKDMLNLGDTSLIRDLDEMLKDWEKM